MKKYLFMAALFMASTTFAGTVYVTTSHDGVSKEQALFYNQMMVKTDQHEELPQLLDSFDYTTATPSYFLKYSDLSSINLQWIALNDLSLTNFKQINLANCSTTIAPNETKHINIIVSGSVVKDGVDNRTATCEITLAKE